MTSQVVVTCRTRLPRTGRVVRSGGARHVTNVEAQAAHYIRPITPRLFVSHSCKRSVVTPARTSAANG